MACLIEGSQRNILKQIKIYKKNAMPYTIHHYQQPIIHHTAGRSPK